MEKTMQDLTREYLQKAQEQLKAAQNDIINNVDLYAKLNDMIFALDDLVDEPIFRPGEKQCF